MEAKVHRATSLLSARVPSRNVDAIYFLIQINGDWRAAGYSGFRTTSSCMFLDSTVARLHAHPNVYVDLGALQVGPRPGSYRYLRGLVESGFGSRIVFGSDIPTAVASGIEAIRTADVLSDEQKADILCLNATRFLWIAAGICAP